MEDQTGQKPDIAALAEELHVSEDLANMVVIESEGELEKARTILQNMMPKYLVIKVRFESPKPAGGSGIILVIIKKDVKKFVLFRAVYDDDRSWADDINVHQPADVFLKLIRNYFSSRPTTSRFFDAEKLRKGLGPLQDIEALQYLFELWDRPKVEVVELPNPTTEFKDPGAILTGLFKKTISDALLDNMEVDLDYDFYTEGQFEAISQMLGLKLTNRTGTQDDESESKSGEHESGFKVYLRGQFVIDVINGVTVQQLETGDKVYCEITDKTAVAITVGKMIGAYKRGLWLPIRGTITDIKATSSDRKLITIAVAKGIFVNVLTMDDIKVRTFGMSTEDRITEAQEKTSDTSMVPLLIGVGLLAFLILVLMMLR